LESALGERPNTSTEETVDPQDPETSTARQGKKKQVHSRIDKGCSRKHRELAWEKVKKPRGRAGIDDVTIAQFEARQEFSLDLRHRKRRAGTYRPQPVMRVELPKSEAGVRKLGIPTVLDRVCQQALVQRMEPICEPTFRDSAFGDRRRSPHAAMRQVWGELNKGHVWIVEAARRQCFDTIDQERLIDWIAEEISDGRVLQRVRDMRRAGVMEGGVLEANTDRGAPRRGGQSVVVHQLPDTV
jgi:RNA-directed DNA polymerase